MGIISDIENDYYRKLWCLKKNGLIGVGILATIYSSLSIPSTIQRSVSIVGELLNFDSGATIFLSGVFIFLIWMIEIIKYGEPSTN